MSEHLIVATYLAAGSALVMLAGVIAGTLHIAMFVVPMFVYLLAVGLINPIGMALVLEPFPEIAGKTSALLGFMQMLFAATASLLVSGLHDDTAMPATVVVAVSGVMVAISHALLRRNASGG